MTTYVGLDVAQRSTEICVLDTQGEVIWQGACDSNPAAIHAAVSQHAPSCEIIAFETGPLAVWHWHSLSELGLPVVCLHARHVHAAIALQVNKTDKNDALAIAQVAKSGWFRPVDVKSFDSHRVRLMLTARARVVSMRVALYSQIRGVLKTFGIVLPPGRGARFERIVTEAIQRDIYLEQVVGPLLGLWRSLSDELRCDNRDLARLARKSTTCKILMTAPGVGVLTALAFMSTIDNPARFKRSEDVGAYLGLTPKRYQSGAVDRTGRISKTGDRMTRSLLFEAANVLLTRSKSDSSIKNWGCDLALRVGRKKAKVAVARKLAVVMHRMWSNGTPFDPMPA